MFLKHYLKIYIKINLILFQKWAIYEQSIFTNIYNIKHYNIINNNDHLKVILRTKDLISFYEKSREHYYKQL